VDSLGTQARVAATFSDVYTGATLSSIPFYLTGSFNDWEGNITAERGLTTGPSGRWQFPSLWHTFSVAVPPNMDTLQIIMVDTVTLTGDMRGNPLPVPPPPGAGASSPPPPLPPFSPGEVASEADASTDTAAGAGAGFAAGPAGSPYGRRRRGRSLSGALSGASRRLRDFNLRNNPPVSTAQWRWLEHVMNTSAADWMIVVGNDPVWSVGEHGPTWGLVTSLLPLMDARGVALYISGRDPVAQHFAPSVQYPSVDFVSIGNGAVANSTMASVAPSASLCPPGTLRFAYGNDTGFLTIALTPTGGRVPSTMTVTFYDSTGAATYSFSKTNSRVPATPWGQESKAVAPEVAHGNAWLIGAFGGAVLFGGLYFAYLSYTAAQEEAARLRRVAAGASRAKAGGKGKGAGTTERSPLLRVVSVSPAPGAATEWSAAL
jgi:hypothetical protein